MREETGAMADEVGRWEFHRIVEAIRTPWYWAIHLDDGFGINAPLGSRVAPKVGDTIGLLMRDDGNCIHMTLGEYTVYELPADASDEVHEALMRQIFTAPPYGQSPAKAALRPPSK